MTDEKNLDSVTIRVDRERSVQLDHTCAKCGATAKSTPVSYDSVLRGTGFSDGKTFYVNSATPPEGWEHIRITDSEKTWHLEVCPKCIREFFGVKS